MMRKFLAILTFLLFSAIAQAAPVVFYTDVTSGPNTGGEGNNGTILTIYGKRFGAVQGGSTVTVGGGAVATYKTWSDTKVAVAIGASAVTGTVVVTTIAGASACADTVDNCQFTVRAGNLWFVAGTGNDTTGNGSYATPWLTLFKARSMVAAGDTVYAMTGSDQKCHTDSGTSITFKVGSGKGVTGTSGNPISFVVYPGDTVQIGTQDKAGDGCTPTSQQYVIYIDTNYNYWTFAGFTIRNYGAASGNNIGGPVHSNATNTRWIANDISAPYSDYAGIMPAGSYGYMYGNTIHDGGSLLTSPAASDSKMYHPVYAQTNHLWIGWNTFDNNYGCRHIQVGQDNVHGFYDIHIFANSFSDDNCEAINLENIDPSLGTVEVYNNLIWHTGTNAQGVGGTYAGIRVSDYDTGTCACPGSGTVEVYNNTIYDAGSYVSAGTSGGAINKGSNLNIDVNLRNNVIQQLAGEKYVCSSGHDCTTDTPPSTRLAHITGNNNLWYGASVAAPTQTTANITGDPAFVSTVTPDFHLTGSSAALNAGVTIATASPDFDGIARPVGASYVVGAYEPFYGAATNLGFCVQPSSAQAAAVITPAVEVCVQDANSLTVADSTAEVTMTNTGCGALGGDVAVNAVAGIATFSDLTLGTAGSACTLTAASVGLTGIGSDPFNITGTTAAYFLVTGYTSPAPGAASSCTVTAKKADGTTDITYTGTVGQTSSDAAATLIADYAFIGGDSGSHFFADCGTLRTAGTQSITFTDLTNYPAGSQTGIVVKQLWF